MGILNARPKLMRDEAIRWRTRANRVMSPRFTSGGQLVVTDQRMFFQPNRFDAVTGRKPWECSLGGVVGIETVGRDRAVLAGGARERLGIQTKDGSEVFVVNDLKKKVTELRELINDNSTP